ncbi:MAG TPA: hypothetical protein PLB81_10140 [Deltaproteobacteria bacterium]|nr:hypothetical protein [Deltaproteobacteria bacterium]
MKIRDWFRNEWIGEATVAGLNEAMQDLDYTWGVHANDFNKDKTLTLVKSEKAYPEKKAA